MIPFFEGKCSATDESDTFDQGEKKIKLDQWENELMNSKSILLTGSNGIRASLFSIKATDMRLKAEPEIESDNLFFLWKKKCSSPSTERSSFKESVLQIKTAPPNFDGINILLLFFVRDKGLCHRQRIRQSFLGYKRQEHSFIYGWCVKQEQEIQFFLERIYMFEQNSRNDMTRRGLYFMKNERKTKLHSKFQVNERSS